MSKQRKKVLIILLTIGFIASLGANLYLYNSNSKNRNSKIFLQQQYNNVLSGYENSILLTSQTILSTLESATTNKKLSSEDILLLYKSYEQLDLDQRAYAYYVQDYNSPDGKKAFPHDLNEPITLNYVPGFVYFNLSRAMFHQLALQNITDSNSEIEVTNNLEKRLKLATEIIQLNTAVYEKYLNKDFDPQSDAAILTRLKLQQELILLSTKLVELDGELLKLDD